MIELLCKELQERFPLITSIRTQRLPPLPRSLEDAKKGVSSEKEAGEKEAEALDEPKASTKEAGEKKNDMVASDESAAISEKTEEGGEAWPSYRMEIVLSSYQAMQKTSILGELARMSLGKAIWIEPVILGEYEAKELSALGEEESARPLASLALLREKGALQARHHLHAAMDEILRVLWLLEQEFTTNGTHTALAALKLERLFLQLLRWVFAMEGKVFREDAQSWGFFRDQLCGEGKIFAASFAGYPLLLRAFVNRHDALSVLLSPSYGENDLEIDQLVFPLQEAAKAIKTAALVTLYDPIEATQRQRRKKLVWAASAFALLLLLGGAIWFALPPSFQAVVKPPGTRIGGIVGRYYKGQDFQTFFRQRGDYEINFSTDKSVMPGLPNDHFSIRWEGYLEAPTAGSYRLCLRMDDGVRLFLHNKRLINEWRVGAARTRCTHVRLAKGWHPLRIDYFERGWMAVLRFLWQPPDAKQPHLIPAKHLCCQP
jgi:hypothetical protein